MKPRQDKTRVKAWIKALPRGPAGLFWELSLFFSFKVTAFPPFLFVFFAVSSGALLRPKEESRRNYYFPLGKPFAPLAFTRLQALPAVPSFTGKCQKTPGWNKKAFLFSDFPVENSKVSKNPGLEQKRARRACGPERPYL